MENFAGYFAFTDHEVGRLLDAVKELPDAENTLVIYIVGDNGASAEGGPDGTLNEIRNLNGLSDADRGCPGESRQARRPRNRTALSGRLGLGGQHAIPVGQAGRLASWAARAIRWSSDGPRRSNTTTSRATPSCT